jgi:hypothetical protein
MNCQIILFSFSTIVITPRLNLATLITAGGTTETERRKISGPEITRTEFTPVSAELMEIASILR